MFLIKGIYLEIAQLKKLGKCLRIANAPASCPAVSGLDCHGPRAMATGHASPAPVDEPMLRNVNH